MSLSSSLFCDNCGAANRPGARFCRACGLTLQPSDTITINNHTTLTGLLSAQTLLNQRYSILGQSGRGGFGAVYKAFDEQSGQRIVAVKEMSQSSLDPQEMVEATAAFKREAELLEGLAHPNLPAIYDQFTENGRSYLVMDFIDGEPLETMLARMGSAKMPLDKVLDIALQLCSVLDYLHTRQPPIIFRDLKPGNIMLTPTRQVYLIDFGIARIFKPGQDKDTTALGSYGYAPPEQYGKSQTTVRSDIYSLGATLHQLLSGDDPSETPFQFSPLKLSDLTLSELGLLVTRMVNVDISKRPASISVVRQELQAITQRYTHGNTLPRMAAKTITRSAPFNGISGVIDAIQRNSNSDVTLPSLPAKSNVSTDVANTAKVAKQSNKKNGPLPIAPQANMLFVCTGHSNRVTTVAWSPDGKYLASASYDKTIQIWNGNNGQHLKTLKGHQGRVNALSWSPDSSMLASASDDQTVRLWHPLTTLTRYVFKLHTDVVTSVDWSPDGKYIVSSDEAAQVLVWEADTEAHVLLIPFQEHKDAVLSVEWSPDGKYIASAGKDAVVRIWEPQKLLQKRNWLSTLFFPNPGQQSWHGHNGKLVALSWSPDSKQIAAACNDHLVRVRDFSPESGGAPATTSLGIDNSTVKNTLAWSPAGKYLAVGGNDKVVRIWNVAAQQETYIYHGHVGYIISVAWSPDGSRIASTGVDRTIQVWQTR